VALGVFHDHVRAVSATSFASRTDCLLDAVRTAVDARRRLVAAEVTAGLPEVELHLRLRDALVRAKRALTNGYH
jgi:hypothetical protein